MKVNVLREFPYSEDGLKVVTVGPGPVDIRDELVPGLAEERLVALSTEVSSAGSEVEIPENWRDLHHKTLIMLAGKITSTVTTKAEAIAAIEAELARRVGVAGGEPVAPASVAEEPPAAGSAVVPPQPVDAAAAAPADTQV